MAIGVLSLAVVAMLGLFAPTMNSVKQVVDGNKATALVGLINAEVNEEILFDDIGTALRDGSIMYFYAWEREYEVGNGNKISEVVISEPGNTEPGSTSVKTSSSSTIDANSPLDDSDNLAGPAFVVTFERLSLGAGNDYPYGTYGTEAYIPFLVTIYQLDLDQLKVNNGFDSDKLNEATRVISYPSAKLR